MKALRFCHVLYVLQSLYMVNCYKVRPSLYDPVELVHFQLQDGSEDVNKNRYDVIPSYTLSPSRPALPLLSRGERETGFDEYLDGTAEPSCRELRKMWRLARKIHNKAVETNEIPRKVHSFADFEADRFRNARRFRGKSGSSSPRNRSKGSKGGSKEEDVYGTVSYSQDSETVKRPRDHMRTVYTELRDPDTPLSSDPNPGAWNSGIQYFEKSAPKPSHFDNLHSELRGSQGLPARLDKGSGRDWGKLLYREKQRKPSQFDLLRSTLKQDGGRSRLNYRDETSGSIQTGGIVDKDRWNRRKNLRKHKHPDRKIEEVEQALLDGFRRNQLPIQTQQLRKGKKDEAKKRFREREFYKNLMLKGK